MKAGGRTAGLKLPQTRYMFRAWPCQSNNWSVKRANSRRSRRRSFLTGCWWKPLRNLILGLMRHGDRKSDGASPTLKAAGNQGWTVTKSWPSCERSSGGETAAVPSGGAGGNPGGGRTLRGDSARAWIAVLRHDGEADPRSAGAAGHVPGFRSAGAPAFWSSISLRRGLSRPAGSRVDRGRDAFQAAAGLLGRPAGVGAMSPGRAACPRIALLQPSVRGINAFHPQGVRASLHHG
jgi:hypothetical protein